jgi:hypothetical protein
MDPNEMGAEKLKISAASNAVALLPPESPRFGASIAEPGTEFPFIQRESAEAGHAAQTKLCAVPESAS